MYPNPAAPDDPNTAIHPSHDPVPPGWTAIPYTYVVIEREDPPA